jgi:beta-N-acetylglucosaminidase
MYDIERKKDMKKIKKRCEISLRLLCALLTVVLPFVNMIKAYAEPLTGIAMADTNVRSIPGTGYSASILGVVETGMTITIYDTLPTSDGSTGCTSGKWYLINYNNQTAYICSKNFDVTNEYTRPWTTPKLAIIGGAKYKAKNYIAQGQYTSYLVKFNVNPNSTYNVYTHQYMTNVRAVASEASTSYSAYLANGLLDQPLVFAIPVFTNMPTEYTALPQGATDTTGQDEVTDTDFEAKLDAQGFPESYKRKLRALHNAYPSWIFESLLTGLDWIDSVNHEQPSSYVDGSNEALRETYTDARNDGVSCKDGSGSYCLKEGNNWYLANTQTTAYYLDPRNFLTDRYILMFEKLAFSPVHNEKVIQTLLNSTFMQGMSALDNQTYASIFVEAGQAANVSAIYLASLAIQESGTNGSMATTGEQFTYNGVTYQGLFNFFNIGASSSETSPIRAGLVWANGGSQTTIVGGGSVPVSKTEGDYLGRLGLNKNTGYLTGIDISRTAGSLQSQLLDANITVTNATGSVLSSDDKIGTGYKVIINDGTNKYESTVVIYGDINGDGSVNAIDLLYMRKYLLNTQELNGANLQAAKIAKGSSVGAPDLLYLRKYLFDSNTYKISQ